MLGVLGKLVTEAISIAAGAAAVWYFGDYFTNWFGWQRAPWLAPMGEFVLVYIACSAILNSGTAGRGGKLSGGGAWASPLIRRAIGVGVYVAIGVCAWFVVACALSLAFLYWALGSWAFVDFRFSLNAFLRPLLIGEANPVRVSLWAGSLLLIALFSWRAPIVMWPAKPVIARITRPVRRLWRAFKRGVGGSSEFDGLMDEWGMQWRPGQLLLGTSLYEPGQRLGRSDDRHVLTVATSRAGKGRSGIIPNLLTWPGAAFVIDPKGQNAAVTAGPRRRMGQTVYIIDPFKELDKLGAVPKGCTVSRFNPLSAIGLGDRDMVEQIRNIAAALVVPTTQGNPFWDNAALDLLTGIIAHVVTSPSIKEEDRNLVTVRLFIAHAGTALKQLEKNQEAGGLPATAYAEFVSAGPTAQGDILKTLSTHVGWLDSLPMKETLSKSDFDLSTLKSNAASLYLVIPPHYLKTHARYLRLFLTLALRAAGQGAKPKHPMLFVLDEFFSLGKLEVVETAAGQLAGMGVKLWVIVQNLTQLQIYGENWETFVANAGQTQVFAVNDKTTAQYFSERLGHHMAWQKVATVNGTNWVPLGATFLRTGVELAEESSRDSGNALVFYEGGRAAMVRRAPYDEMFSPHDYDADPYEPAAQRRHQARTRSWGAWLTALLNRGRRTPAPDAPLHAEAEPERPRQAEEMAQPSADQSAEQVQEAAAAFEDIAQGMFRDAPQPDEAGDEQAARKAKRQARRKAGMKKPTATAAEAEAIAAETMKAFEEEMATMGAKIRSAGRKKADAGQEQGRGRPD